ncbi:IBR domain-containing protein [Nannizzia gypsea CBS 118893]|uniref:IBR domain-containing protein n=1 Tax=Arthroderma gypseum (strain ATCC MYA-4604 / CBS 118893) TaxID=535722 RepID=E5R0X6_ARTGP|nr:IBR domain-containing protein [Nannizzia gypsea CBS 118893]EFQ98418.1 IBR domain-containing protein [Nannizzia gypsea CBS 118893]
MSYSNLEGLDPAIARLIIQLQLDDLQEIKVQSKGETHDGELADPDLSLELYSDELSKSANLLRDTLLTRSIATAIHSDQDTLRDFLKVEHQSYQDRQLARHRGETNFYSKELSFKVRHSVTCKSLPLSSIRSQKYPPSEALACGICFKQVRAFEFTRLSCSHLACSECLQKLFREFLFGDAQFPPQCCAQHIIFEQIARFLTPNLATSFLKQKAQFDADDRTCCSTPYCSRAIPSKNIEGRRATCPYCNTVTCAVCKSESHEGDCPDNATLPTAVSPGTRSKRLRCYLCSNFVELAPGRDHKTSFRISKRKPDYGKGELGKSSTKIREVAGAK